MRKVKEFEATRSEAGGEATTAKANLDSIVKKLVESQDALKGKYSKLEKMVAAHGEELQKAYLDGQELTREWPRP